MSEVAVNGGMDRDEFLMRTSARNGATNDARFHDRHHRRKMNDFRRRVEVAERISGHAAESIVGAGWSQSALV